jgi:hypothetical protein
MALASAKIDCGHATKAINLCPNLDFFSSEWITIAHHPSRVDANHGDHLLQADSQD